MSMQAMRLFTAAPGLAEPCLSTGEWFDVQRGCICAELGKCCHQSDKILPGHGVFVLLNWHGMFDRDLH